MEITAALVKELRERTGAGMMDCKKALVENKGDFEQSIAWLRKKGIASAAKKVGRTAKEGAVSSYIHGEGRVGVLVEVNCETDFVARTEHFREFVKNVGMQIAAANPQWLNPEEVPEDMIAREKDIALAQAKQSGKPEAILQKMVDGRVEKYLDEVCLLRQVYVKDGTKKIHQYLAEVIAQVGENVMIRRFSRFQLGEGIEAKAE